jgi:adenylate cyclase associated (CAP) protein
MAGQVHHLPARTTSPEARELRDLIERLEKVVDRLEELECEEDQGGPEDRA